MPMMGAAAFEEEEDRRGGRLSGRIGIGHMPVLLLLAHWAPGDDLNIALCLFVERLVNVCASSA